MLGRAHLTCGGVPGRILFYQYCVSSSMCEKKAGFRSRSMLPAVHCGNNLHVPLSEGWQILRQLHMSFCRNYAVGLAAVCPFWANSPMIRDEEIWFCATACIGALCLSFRRLLFMV